MGFVEDHQTLERHRARLIERRDEFRDEIASLPPEDEHRGMEEQRVLTLKSAFEGDVEASGS